MATLSSSPQRSGTLLARGCHICTMVQQPLGHSLMATISSSHQRGDNIVACGCYICTMV